MPALLILAWAFHVPPACAAIVLPQPGGDELVLDAAAQRIITLAPNLAELVFAAGAGDRLAGVVEYSHFPPAARQKPQKGESVCAQSGNGKSGNNR